MHTPNPTLFALALLFLTPPLTVAFPIITASKLDALERYLDFNIKPLSLSYTFGKRSLHSDLHRPDTHPIQSPARSLHNGRQSRDPINQELRADPDPTPASTRCSFVPRLDGAAVKASLAVLLAEIASAHLHGVAFPYSWWRNAPSPVVLTATTLLPDDVLAPAQLDAAGSEPRDDAEGRKERYSAVLEVVLESKPRPEGGRKMRGVTSEHLGSLLESLKGSGGDGWEREVTMGSKVLVNEGVSGGIGYEARWAVYDLASKRAARRCS